MSNVIRTREFKELVSPSTFGHKKNPSTKSKMPFCNTKRMYTFGAQIPSIWLLQLVTMKMHVFSNGNIFNSKAQMPLHRDRSRSPLQMTTWYTPFFFLLSTESILFKDFSNHSTHSVVHPFHSICLLLMPLFEYFISFFSSRFVVFLVASFVSCFLLPLSRTSSLMQTSVIHKARQNDNIKIMYLRIYNRYMHNATKH